METSMHLYILVSPTAEKSYITSFPFVLICSFSIINRMDATSFADVTGQKTSGATRASETISSVWMRRRIEMNISCQCRLQCLMLAPDPPPFFVLLPAAFAQSSTSAADGCHLVFGNSLTPLRVCLSWMVGVVADWSQRVISFWLS